MKKVYRSEDEIKRLLIEMVEWMLEQYNNNQHVSTSITAENFNVPKTTFKRWINTYLKEISLDYYEQIICIFNQNSKKSQYRRDLINKRTKELAEAILADENKDVPVYLIIDKLGYDRKRSMQLVYDNLKKLDKTSDKSYYISVLKQIRHNTNTLSKVNELLNQVEQEVRLEQQSRYQPSIDLKILKAAHDFLSGVPLSEIAERNTERNEVSEKDIIGAFEEVLGNIDVDLEQKVLVKLNKNFKIHYRG